MRILVTGGSRGIGRAIVELLGNDHDIAIGYRTSKAAAADLATSLDGSAITVGGDVSDPASATSMVEEAVAELGDLDAVVNNAGTVDPGLATDLTTEQWESVVGTNLSGAFYVTRAALPHVAPGGDIVFISSIGGTAGTVDASYAASKAGLHGLTRALAREHGEQDVQVNAIAPGPVTTEMNDTIVSYLESTAFRGHEGIDTHLPTYACEPAEIARSVEFVLESTYLQGEILNINGGMQFR